jgi:N-acetylglucosaminyldiphosphoundecaprenol N-acetyl-beta-D-mannosaminyltransferase
MKETILGYEIDSLTIEGCVTDIFSTLSVSANDSRHCEWLACINPHSYVVSLNDEKFARALRDASWIVPDGAGIVIASRLLGGAIHQRVTGSDVFTGLHKRLNGMGGMSVFFLGSTEETLTLIRMRMAQDYPNIKVAGTYSPPFKPDYSQTENSEMISAVNASNADVLWVGMTAPKQEKWLFDNRSKLNVKFAGAIGAVFDFYTGRVKRAHPLFQRLGLEWLPRLVQQPIRLWKRMFVSAPIFVWHVLLARVNRRVDNT